jgi:hypothetical protein
LPPSRRTRRSPSTRRGCATCALPPHQLSDELEKALHEKYVVGRAAWSRLFDETIARLRYPFRNEVLTEPQILDKLSNKDAEVPQGRAKSFGKVQGDNIAIFSLVTNTLLKDKEIDDRWRKYPRPQSFRNPRQRGRGRGVDALVLVGEGGLSAAWRIATTSSRPSGSASTRCRTGTATRLCPSTTIA